MNEELLIANTTREERQRIVNESLGIIDGSCDGCAMGVHDGMKNGLLFFRLDDMEVTAVPMISRK